MNHLHIADIHYVGCDDLSKDKVVVLGNVLKEIYEAKLKVRFPDRPCVVEFRVPKDEEDLSGYQISFWQES
jgi:methyl coenzyme M reductase subunit C